MQPANVVQSSAPIPYKPKKRLAWVGQVFLAAMALFIVYTIILNAVKSPSLFIQIILSGLQLGFVYALVALGYTMVYGIVKLINFAHGDVIMVGSYIAITTIPLMAAMGAPAWTCIVASVIFCAILGFLIEAVAYRPLRNAPRLCSIITAIGM